MAKPGLKATEKDTPHASWEEVRDYVNAVPDGISPSMLLNMISGILYRYQVTDLQVDMVLRRVADEFPNYRAAQDAANKAAASRLH